MHFSYATQIASTFPELVTGLLIVTGVNEIASTEARVDELEAVAKARLGDGTESDLPEIRAWRSAYARMGFKPTQVRCASEALLRRLRQHGSLPQLHPLVDLCNAASAAAALPIAAFDLATIEGDLIVGPAEGSERYRTFGGEIENPEPGETVFRDNAGNVHARRWVNRQSGLSAISTTTDEALLVIEGMHDKAERDVTALRDQLVEDIAEAGGAPGPAEILCAAIGTFEITAPSS